MIFGLERSIVWVFLRPFLLKLLIDESSWDLSPEGAGDGDVEAEDGGGGGGGGPPGRFVEVIAGGGGGGGGGGGDDVDEGTFTVSFFTDELDALLNGETVCNDGYGEPGIEEFSENAESDFVEPVSEPKLPELKFILSGLLWAKNKKYKLNTYHKIV